jgi:hypothetical protein
MSLDTVLLREGSWAEVLDALRQTFHRQDLRFRPRISMTHLSGGNSGILRDQLAHANATVEEPSPAGEITHRTIDDKLMELFQAYITSDQITANPGLGNFEK